MKELSIEEKAKAYDEALEIARKNLEAIEEHGEGTSFAYDGVKNTLIHIFPELKESEDEKIRKELIEHIKANCETDFILFQKFSPDDIIAWLEKKREQKQVIIAKFQIGDKVRLKGSCGWYNVAEIRGNAYYLTSHDVVPCLLPICEQDNWEVEQKPTDNDIKEALRTEYEKGRADAMAEFQKEWSEEDEFMATAVENSFYLHCGQMTDRLSEQYKKFFKKVKSLRPQNMWKPSDEQVEAFEHFVRSIGESGYACPYDNNTKLLYLLLSDLKKLKA